VLKNKKVREKFLESEKNFQGKLESSRKFFQEKIGDHKDFSKKKFGRLYENKLKNLMRKIFTSEKQYQIKN